MSKLILDAAAALLIASPAFAGAVRATEDAPTQAVSTQGVNFATRADVKHFYARLRGAIAAVCDSGSANPVFSSTDAACAREVTAQAVQAANKPVLTELYNAQVDNSRAFACNDQ